MRKRPLCHRAYCGIAALQGNVVELSIHWLVNRGMIFPELLVVGNVTRSRSKTAHRDMSNMGYNQQVRKGGRGKVDGAG